MPKVSVYLPDDLYEAARSRGLPLSRLTQQAIRDSIEHAPNAAWLDQVRTRPRRHETEIDTGALIEDVREDFGA